MHRAPTTTASDCCCPTGTPYRQRQALLLLLLLLDNLLCPYDLSMLYPHPVLLVVRRCCAWQLTTTTAQHHSQDWVGTSHQLMELISRLPFFPMAATQNMHACSLPP